MASEEDVAAACSGIGARPESWPRSGMPCERRKRKGKEREEGRGRKKDTIHKG